MTYPDFGEQITDSYAMANRSVGRGIIRPLSLLCCAAAAWAMKGQRSFSYAGGPGSPLVQWYDFSFLSGGHISTSVEIVGVEQQISDDRAVWALACTSSEVNALVQDARDNALCGRGRSFASQWCVHTVLPALLLDARLTQHSSLQFL